MQETWAWSLGQEDTLEQEMATHSSILAWRLLWTAEPGRPQSMGSQSRTWLSNWTTTLETTTYFLYPWHLNICEISHKGFSWHLILAPLENVFLWCSPYPIYTDSQKANFPYAVLLTFKIITSIFFSSVIV